MGALIGSESAPDDVALLMIRFGASPSAQEGALHRRLKPRRRVTPGCANGPTVTSS
jgi:hypothetical protein